MAIEANKVVTMNFTLKDEKGTVLDTTENSQPFTYISGNNQVIAKLEETVNSMIIGAKKHIKLEASDAYGAYNEKAVQKLERSNFPKDAELEVGMQYVANSPDGKQMPFIINEVEENHITADFNHPLAGKDLEFDVELLDVRDATQEELEHGHVHGPGTNHH